MSPNPAPAQSLHLDNLQQALAGLSGDIDGRVGICVRDASGAACVNGADRFSLQSVMKLVVGLAVLEAVDGGQLKLDDIILVQRDDLSLYVQPIAALVGEKGYRTTIGDLIRRAVIDSDSAAADILIRRLGGTEKVQAFLNRHAVTDLRIDRDERHLQTDIVGLSWKPAYTDAAVLERDIAAVPDARRTAAYKAYQADPRDTATPRAMTDLLFQLAAGKLLSPASTHWMMATMRDTATFPDRLKAGLSPGWTLGHKTGSSGAWQGVTAATNDVGIMTAPDGTHIAITVFIGDTRAPAADRAALMARASAAAIAHYRP